MATLAIYRGDQFERRVELVEAPMRIGRAPENEIVLEDSNKGVSRAHAEIRFEDGRYLIADLNSQNGVWLGGQRVKREPRPIDAPITIGPYRLVVETEPHTPSSLNRSDAAAAKEPGADEEFTEPTQLAHATPHTSPPPAAVAAAPVTPASPPVRRRSGRLPLIAGGIVAAGLGAWAVMAALNSAPKAGSFPPPTTTTTTTSVPAPPPQPTQEETENLKREQDFKERLTEARDALDKKDKAAATAAIDSALELKPDDTEAKALREDIEKLPTATAQAPPPPPPGPPVATTFTVLPRARETRKARQEREKNARDALLTGIKQFENGNYQQAIASLESSIRNSDRRDFGQVPNEAQTYIERSNTQLDTKAKLQRTERAHALIEEAKLLAPKDVVAAIAKMREAQDADNAADGLKELRATLFAQAATEGAKAYSDARNSQARHKASDALADYTRAVRLLEFMPGGHEQELEDAKKQIRELSIVK